MAYSDTVLKQLIALVPRYEFDALAKSHHAGKKFRAYDRWSQFLAMLIGQLAGRKSLRDITNNLKAQGRRLYHLGMKQTARVTLARVNAEQPASLYQALFGQLLNCLVPLSNGICYTDLRREELWDTYSMLVLGRLRKCIERYKIIKKA